MSATIQPELIPATDSNWKPAKAELATITPMALMQVALEHGQVEQLQILQEMYFKDMARKAEVEFNLAMNAAQAEMTRIVPDGYNSQTKSKHATYAKLDAVIRPIYIKHGFSLSFDSGDCSVPDNVVAYCYVSHSAGHTRKYQSPPMPKPILGPQGKPVMTETHGTGSAMSYAMRYLLKYIFNIAVGEDDTDGNAPVSKSTFTIDDYDELQDRLNYFSSCTTMAELKEHWNKCRAWAKSKKDEEAVDQIDARKDARKAEIEGGAS